MSCHARKAQHQPVAVRTKGATPSPLGASKVHSPATRHTAGKRYNECLSAALEARCFWTNGSV